MDIFIRGLAVIAALITFVQHRPAAADDYPSRPVTLIAPWPAGGAVDTLCRIFAARLTDRLGKTVVVDNRPGAGSVLGVAATARAAPDGYTLVMAGSAALATTVTIYRKLPYDPSKDFAPLALITRIPFVLVVNPSLPVNSVTDLIKAGQERTGPAVLCFRRARLPASSLYRIVQEHDRHRNAARALQRQRASAQ